MKLKIYFIKSVDFYQRNISSFIKPSCVFYPSCSEYAKQAVDKYGITRGSGMAVLRVLRCHPWQKNHLDPLP